MTALQDRRVLAAAGAALAIVVGVALGGVFMLREKPGADAGDPANRSLTVEMSEAARVDPDRELRCFVGGQLVGTATLADCAKRNGVSAQALDVGLTETGELAAGGELAPLQPLDNAAVPVEAAPPPMDVAATPPPAVQANDGECLRFGGDGWRVIGSMPLNACVQQLFDGRCQRPGEGLYGRWGAQTLRLVSTRVESSNNNRDFATLVEQGPNCALPPL